MAIKWLNSGRLDQFGSSGGTVSTSTSVAYSGGAASLRVNPTTTAVGYAYRGVANRYVRGMFRIDTLPASGSEEILRAHRGNVVGMGLRIRSDGKLEIFQGTTSRGTGATVLSTGTWYRINADFYPSTKIMTVLLDGVSEVTGGDSTRFPTNANWSWGKEFDRNGQTIDIYWDDIAEGDSEIASGQVGELVPTSNSSFGWTDGAGTAPTNVSELDQDGDTSYIKSVADGTAKAMFAHGGCSGAGISGTINCVMLDACFKRDGGSDGLAATRLESGVSSSQAADYTVGASYGWTGWAAATTHLMTVDPVTSSAWTTSGLDAATIGVIDRDSLGFNVSRATAVRALVDFTPAAAPSASWVVGGGIIGTGSAG